MGKFTKLMLTFALLIAGVGGVNARTNVDMSTVTVSTNATWDPETNTFSWTAQDAYIVIPGLSGDLTGCYLNFTKGQAVDSRIDIVYTDNSVTKGAWNGFGMFGASTGAKTQDLGAMAGEKINNVKEVRFCSATTSGSLTLTDISYFYPVVPQFNADGVATINLKSLVASGGLSFDASTGVVTCDGNIGTLSLEFLNGVNLTGLKRYDVSISGTDNIMWRSIVKSQGTDVLAYYGSKWGGDLTGDQRAKALSVNEFFWESKSSDELSKVAEGNRTFTINSITLIADKMNAVNAHDVPIATLPHYNVAADGTVSLGSAISTSYGSDVDTPLGDGADDNNEYIDISDYDELRIYTSEFATNHPRVFFFNADHIEEGTNLTKGTTLYLNDAIFSYNSTENYYYATITAIKDKCNGLAKVIGVKKNSYIAPGITVSKIQVYKANTTYDYILSGQYSSAVDVSTITSDATVTAIDCSGLSGNGVAISSANPNCLFVANAGVLSNAKNVIVDGTCANLELTDGKPFKAPAAFTATAAPTYDRAFTASTTTTVCLPFALTAAEAATLGTFYELSNFDGSTLRFTSVDAPVANKAYLVKTKAADPALTLSETGKSIVATPANLGTTVTNVDFIGTLESTVIPASGDDYSYYAYNNGSLVKIVTNAATLPAFRGYFKVTTSAISAARSLNISFDNEATGISDALMNSDERIVKSEVYNLNGQRVAAPQKGLYIVNGKKVIVK